MGVRVRVRVRTAERLRLLLRDESGRDEGRSLSVKLMGGCSRVRSGSILVRRGSYSQGPIVRVSSRAQKVGARMTTYEQVVRRGESARLLCWIPSLLYQIRKRRISRRPTLAVEFERASSPHSKRPSAS